MRRRPAAIAALAAAALPTAVACRRELSRYREPPPATERVVLVRQSPIQPGAAGPTWTPPTSPSEGNSHAISEGRRLFDWYNCSGCHAAGGGGMGPALMDRKWIYGNEPAQVYESIVEGRPNGMPSYGGKIPSSEVWRLVAFVRSLGGIDPQGADAARADHPALTSAAPPRERLPPGHPGMAPR